MNNYSYDVKLYRYDALGRKTREDQIMTAGGVGAGTTMGRNVYGLPNDSPSGSHLIGDVAADQVAVGLLSVDSNQAHDGLITVRNEYDIAGRLIALIDDNGNETAWAYDRFGRKIFETKGIQVAPALADENSSDTTIAWLYDETTGLLETMTKEDGTLLNYAYDSLLRLAEINVTTVSPCIVVGTTHQEFAYDGLGRRIASMDNNNPAETSDDVFVTWAYDSLGRQVEETLRIGQNSTALNPVTTNYSSTHRAALVYPNGRTVEYTYLAGGAMNEIKDSGAQTAIAKYDYIGSRLLLRAMQNGVNLDLRHDNDTGTFYDALGRPLRYAHVIASQSNDVLIGFEHSYDRIGNKKKQDTLPAGGAGNYDKDNQQYAYDSSARLKGYTRGDANGDTRPELNKAQTWELDGLGNWAEFSTTDANDNFRNDSRDNNTFNAYTTGSDLDETHDANGNLTSQTAGARTLSLTWDAFNRLVWVKNGDNWTWFVYDAGNRRVEKGFNDGVNYNPVTEYLYSGWQVLEEREDIEALYYLENEIDLSLQFLHASRQFVDGAMYIDEHLVMDTNLDDDGDCWAAGSDLDFCNFGLAADRLPVSIFILPSASSASH